MRRRIHFIDNEMKACMEFLFDNINTFDTGGIVATECTDVTYAELVALGLA